MDVRQLTYFVKILELRSFTKAASELRIAQPALGLQIRKLEDELQVQLLVRHSRGVEATKAGALLLELARDILQRINCAKQALRDLDRRPYGKVVLGMTPSVNYMLAGQLIAVCSHEVPDVSLAIVEEMSANLTEWVSARRLDLALAYRSDTVHDLVFEPLLVEDLYFVTGPEHKAGDTVKLVEVAASRLILPSLPHGIRRLVESHAAATGVHLDISFEMVSVPTIKELVGQGVGTTILPFGAIRREIEAGILKASLIIEPQITRPLFLVSSQQKPPSKAVATVRDIISRLVAEEMRRHGVWHPPRPTLQTGPTVAS